VGWRFGVVSGYSPASSKGLLATTGSQQASQHLVGPERLSSRHRSVEVLHAQGSALE